MSHTYVCFCCQCFFLHAHSYVFTCVHLEGCALFTPFAGSNTKSRRRLFSEKFCRENLHYLRASWRKRCWNFASTTLPSWILRKEYLMWLELIAKDSGVKNEQKWQTLATLSARWLIHLSSQLAKDKRSLVQLLSPRRKRTDNELYRRALTSPRRLRTDIKLALTDLEDPSLACEAWDVEGLWMVGWSSVMIICHWSFESFKCQSFRTSD